MPIRILSPDVAEKIAAGEVIERPASVVRELVENSLDAGATRVSVRVASGGSAEIMVSDDGCGIPGEEVPLAFSRHATSKLLSLEDLDSLRTLGFRGEALASVGAVADVSLTTRHSGEEHGTRLRFSFGRLGEKGPCAHAGGTLLSVRDLFANVPARRKFLRKPATETQYVVSAVSRYAIAHPEVSFSLETDGREVLRTVGGGLLDAIRRVHGPEVGDALVTFEHRTPDVRAYGYAGPPELHRSSAKHLDLFVNGRAIQDRILTRAVLDAYRDLLPSRRYPIVVLLLEVNPTKLDVNVHPTKAEVRFAEPDAIYEAAYRAVRTAVSDSALVPRLGSPTQATPDLSSFSALLHARAAPSSVGGEPEAEDQLPLAFGNVLPPLRPVGQIQQTYIVAEGPDGLYLVDQHAAHERVLFERFLADRSAGKLASQGLISPLPVSLGSQRLASLERVLPRLREMGFDAEPFGGDVLLIRSVPALLADNGQSLEPSLLDIYDAVAAGDDDRWLEHSLVRLVCHAAVRAGQTLELAEMRDILRSLESTASPRTCPHGRPTMLYLSAMQLEKEFRRR